MRKNQYPTLSKIAKDYLCIPVSSAPTEQTFSMSGNIVTQNRNRLDEKSIRILTTLNSWRNNV